MNLIDFKGHLLTRRANLEAANPKILANVLLAEERLRDLRAELAANSGAIGEVVHTLALLEKEPTP